jgi:hypothetical protein
MTCLTILPRDMGACRTKGAWFSKKPWNRIAVWVVYCIDHNLDRVEIHAQDARSFLFS